jgi:uncharacterized protein DUF6916
MSLTRRRFIEAGTLAAVSTGVALSSARLAFGQNAKHASSNSDFQIPAAAQQDVTAYFTRETFEPYVGDIFQAPNARGRMVSLTLKSVDRYKTKATTKITTKAARQTESFSLMFRATQPLPQHTSIHKVSHPALGEFDLFLTPRKLDDGTYFYEAVFNRL